MPARIDSPEGFMVARARRAARLPVENAYSSH